ncbi:AAA family ATPase [Sporosarcina aquimarina]|uniref:AAA family ATPase n=1 Tax=Sporosarcina aquimarina TaxID=114975 RepID=UPI001C8DE491|nr:ATP-binding protein [Sporosarcina aquimarina]MBY0221622.1 AAA family ATPase [Sporosarcina aquimarina]
MLERLELSDWNQFDEVEINFHPRVTILTGANGAGKSSILRLLAKQIGWDYEEVAKLHIKNSKSSFLAGLNLQKILAFSNANKELKNSLLEEINNSGNYIDTFNMDNLVMGTLRTDKGVFKFYVPEEVHSASYQVETRFKYFDSDEEFYPSEEIIKGVNISSHRQPYSYVRVEEIPLRIDDTKQLYREYLDSLQVRTLNKVYYNNTSSPVHYMKKSLMSLAVFGEGNSLVEPNQEFQKKFDGFAEILRKLLPRHIGFNAIKIESGEVVLKTDSGDFLIDAVSGGLGALIDLAWQVFMFNEDDSEFTVLIDEIENHLHPSMQREILPNLINAFPEAQFIISTHSPFVVNSIKEASVYALKYNENNRVISLNLDFENSSKDAFDILKDVLGVTVTMPVWLENELEEAIKGFDTKKLDLNSYNRLKSYLQSKGLEDYLSEMLQRFEV